MSIACSDDLQCPPGTSCINGACKPCKADDECGEGGRCDKGRCQRAGSNSGTSGANKCAFEPIYLDFDENVLSTEATAGIDRNAECIKKNGNLALTLTGHSDPRGTEEYNLALSDRRAQTVRDRLQRIGANPAAVRMVPKGELEASGTDEAGWAKDRRVDFTN
jgi:peptidoglycan-associated lipoprotein